MLAMNLAISNPMTDNVQTDAQDFIQIFDVVSGRAEQSVVPSVPHDSRQMVKQEPEQGAVAESVRKQLKPTTEDRSESEQPRTQIPTSQATPNVASASSASGETVPDSMKSGVERGWFQAPEPLALHLLTPQKSQSVTVDKQEQRQTPDKSAAGTDTAGAETKTDSRRRQSSTATSAKPWSLASLAGNQKIPATTALSVRIAAAVSNTIARQFSRSMTPIVRGGQLRTIDVPSMKPASRSGVEGTSQQVAVRTDILDALRPSKAKPVVAAANDAEGKTKLSVPADVAVNREQASKLPVHNSPLFEAQSGKRISAGPTARQFAIPATAPETNKGAAPAAAENNANATPGRNDASGTSSNPVPAPATAPRRAITGVVVDSNDSSQIATANRGVISQNSAVPTAGKSESEATGNTARPQVYTPATGQVIAEATLTVPLADPSASAADSVNRPTPLIDLSDVKAAALPVRLSSDLESQLTIPAPAIAYSDVKVQSPVQTSSSVGAVSAPQLNSHAAGFASLSDVKTASSTDQLPRNIQSQPTIPAPAIANSDVKVQSPAQTASSAGVVSAPQLNNHAAGVAFLSDVKTTASPVQVASTREAQPANPGGIIASSDVKVQSPVQTASSADVVSVPQLNNHAAGIAFLSDVKTASSTDQTLSTPESQPTIPAPAIANSDVKVQSPVQTASSADVVSVPQLNNHVAGVTSLSDVKTASSPVQLANTPESQPTIPAGTIVNSDIKVQSPVQTASSADVVSVPQLNNHVAGVTSLSGVKTAPLPDQLPRNIQSQPAIPAPAIANSDVKVQSPVQTASSAGVVSAPQLNSHAAGVASLSDVKTAASPVQLAGALESQPTVPAPAIANSDVKVPSPALSASSANVVLAPQSNVHAAGFQTAQLNGMESVLSAKSASELPASSISSDSADKSAQIPSVIHTAANENQAQHLQVEASHVSSAVQNTSPNGEVVRAQGEVPQPVNHDVASTPRGSDKMAATLRTTEQATDSQTGDQAATSGINVAKVIQSVNHSEMRIGMNSAEFGAISIRASVSQQHVSTSISVDHSELGKEILAYIPSMREKFGEMGLKADVEVSQGAGSSGGSSQSSAREQKPGVSSHVLGEAVTQANEVNIAPVTVSTIKNDRLDIRA